MDFSLTFFNTSNIVEACKKLKAVPPWAVFVVIEESKSDSNLVHFQSNID